VTAPGTRRLGRPASFNAVIAVMVPAERIAFVLHDMFAVPFDEIAPVVERSPATAKKLASRARQKVRGAPALDAAELTRHRRVVETFLAAARAGDVDAVIAVLAPDAELIADPARLRQLDLVVLGLPLPSPS
jgi:RNA polymerase sigma-70 factor (ECF subfamily)